MAQLKIHEEANDVNTHSQDRLWRQILCGNIVWIGIRCRIGESCRLFETYATKHQTTNVKLSL